MLPHSKCALQQPSLQVSMRGQPRCKVTCAAAGAKFSVFQLADHWPLADGPFPEECGRILEFSSGHARCSLSSIVAERYGEPLHPLIRSSSHIEPISMRYI